MPKLELLEVTVNPKTQFNGRHWETGSIQNALALQGMKAPELPAISTNGSVSDGEGSGTPEVRSRGSRNGNH